MASNNPPRSPGDGADQPAHHAATHGYVYVARSRRARGLSLGIDLTPQGHCSFSCIYCQATHPPPREPNLRVDLDVLRADLVATLASAQAPELRDLVFAGSGEPTAAPNFDEAAGVITEVCRSARFDRPMRIFTNGRHLDQARVCDALEQWVDAGGEIWVKLDGASDATLEAVNGRKLDAAKHLEGLWQFARRREVGIQTMLIEGEGLASAESVAEEVIDAVAAGLARGARVKAAHLLTLARIPSAPEQAERLRAISDERLENLARRMRDRTRLSVTVYGAY
jgi:wyosine [tRNA(Phe)-imidazoG37] synthetase (radical SAM superfamily)